MYKPTKRTINWGKDIHFIKLFNTKVSHKWRLTMVMVTKSVLQALPSYVMQSMFHPKSICEYIDKACRNFIWGVSQPTLRQEGDAGLMSASSKKGKCVESPPTFIWGKHRKNRKRCGLRTLSVKGSGVVFTHGKGISTPRVRHKGRQPLIKCANMTL